MPQPSLLASAFCSYSYLAYDLGTERQLEYISNANLSGKKRIGWTRFSPVRPGHEQDWKIVWMPLGEM